ncbi:MAG: hypothetical protein CVV61_07725 [Tenericutes bacterium HGW-Tenericutes-6]|jgi:phosphoglycolate phosphatase|nr:MAG: hypothetical protein CVV61_07725 [Tenericutes bacterium HGW-Tenericutes-6]
MKKVIIFDLDGTLSNNINQSEIIYQRISERYNLKQLSKEEIRKLKSNPKLKRLFELGIPVHKIPKMYKESREIASEFVDESKLVPGIKELITLLNDKNIKLAIVSSNSSSNINKFLSNNDISIFSFIEAKASMKGKKRKLSKILKRNGYKPSDAIYIGDEVRDVLACKAISLEVIAVTWGFETKSILEKSNPNYIVDSVDELSELLLDEHEN